MPHHSIPPEVDEIAKDCAEHRVVPFLGAGCSAAHLGVDWDTLGRRMADRIGLVYSDNISAASEFVERCGRAELAALLSEALHVETFDASKGGIHLQVLGLGLGTLYTTNQDNLVELCHKAHGRPISVVVDIEDIAGLKPGDHVVYKFHGDLTKPDSIVFCAADYALRGPHSSHPLDIRLKSDALGKSLLFLGYSFRDPNVKEMFAHLRSLFGGNLPKSRIVQYGSDPSFVRVLREEFGIDVLDTATLYPSAGSRDESLAFFFRDLVNQTVALKMKGEMDSVFRPKTPPSRRIALASDVKALSAALATVSVDDGIDLFRGHYDLTLIPEAFQDEVVAQLCSLCERATSQEHPQKLEGLLFVPVHRVGSSDGPDRRVECA